ncbi:MAG: hypothetical protein HGGPFJEG_00446 [Ignavibacteria bacterium]|nr:hypothetical protein [Ignavibacteria bacterium]
MEEFFIRFFENLGLKLHGPMKFRFILQPLVALFFAIKAGLRDSKKGSAPFVPGLIKEKEQRRTLLKQSWTDVGKVFIFALIMDIVFQLIVLKTIYPAEAVLTAILLAFIPYFIFRGPANRIISYFNNKE